MKPPWMAILVVTGRLCCGTAGAQQQALRCRMNLGSRPAGLNGMALQNVYPEGHQAGRN